MRGHVQAVPPSACYAGTVGQAVDERITPKMIPLAPANGCSLLRLRTFLTSTERTARRGHAAQQKAHPPESGAYVLIVTRSSSKLSNLQARGTAP